jgi:predicted RNase H-like HicB family nuclease
MSIGEYKTILYLQEDGSWVAEIPAIPGCYALMPSREEALAELSCVFEIISEEYRDKRIPLPADTTEIVHAYRRGARVSKSGWCVRIRQDKIV